jgi:uncharacterized protein YjiS (DUF1127 family)
MSNITDIGPLHRGIVARDTAALLLIDPRFRTIFNVLWIDSYRLTKRALASGITIKVVGIAGVRATVWWSANCLKLWVQRIIMRRQLRLLCELDDHILMDIGMVRCELAFEAYRPFWRNRYDG